MAAEIPSGERVMVTSRPWVGTTPWYQPTANEDIAPPAHQMPSGQTYPTAGPCGWGRGNRWRWGHAGMPRQATALQVVDSQYVILCSCGFFQRLGHAGGDAAGRRPYWRGRMAAKLLHIPLNPTLVEHTRDKVFYINHVPRSGSNYRATASR